MSSSFPFPDIDSNTTNNQAQWSAVEDALKTYGTKVSIDCQHVRYFVPLLISFTATERLGYHHRQRIHSREPSPHQIDFLSPFFPWIHVLNLTDSLSYSQDSLDQVSATTQLLSMIQTYNTSLQAMNLDRAIPLGTADAGSSFTVELAEGVDCA